MITEEELETKGFTATGKARLRKTLESYEEQLVEHSLQVGKYSKASDLPLEVTHEHVRKAADNLMSPLRDKKRSKLSITFQVGEYFCSAGIAYGLAEHATAWGFPLALGSLVLGSLLLVLRVIYSHR